MIPRPTIIPPDIDDLNERIQRSTDDFRKRIAADLGKDGERYRQQLAQEPPRAWQFYPLPWASERQRRAVMAKLRKSGNLPYLRTHQLAQGWKVDIRIDANGDGAYSLTNMTPYSEYVVGERVQPMFVKIGWFASVTSAVEGARISAEAILRADWDAVCKAALEDG